MLKNYFKIFLRNINRFKLYSIINIVGLAVGMTACILILLFIQAEVSYENMHTRAEQIYRVLTIDKALGTNNQRVGITMPALGPALPENFETVEAALRITGGGRTLLRYQDQPAIYAEQMRSADANFFDFFDYPLLQGDPATALQEPCSLVLTESLARQLFGDDPPMGQTLRTGSGTELKVTGILQDLPANTHLEFDALGSIATVASQARANQPPGSTQPIWVEMWQLIAMPTYVRFAEGASIEGIAEKFTQLTRDNGVSENFEITLQPLRDVHLKSTDIIFDQVNNKGDLNSVYIFAAIALLILVIAAVNYMNLSTARSTERAKEVGLRKVVGSRRAQLIGQFLGESLLITLLALLLALPLTWLALPFLNNLAGSALVFDPVGNVPLLLFLVSMLVLVGVLAGLYPAFVLAGFTPVTVLKGSFKTGKKGTALRIGLVVFQFALSIALIGVTLIIQQQLNYVQHKDLGYHKEQVLIFDMFDQNMGQNLETFRTELLQHSAFADAATASNVPGRTFGRTRVRPEGVSDEDIWIWSVFSVSPEALPALGMEMALGRNFSREMATDTSGAVLVNETAMRQLGWDDPLNKRLYFGQQDSVGTGIIGVVKDFHFAGMHQNIEPVVIFPLNSSPGNLLAARIQPGRIPEAMEIAQAAWRDVYPDYPFNYSFLDEEFADLYRRDLNTGKIVNIFSALAILIACLGLFGLASHSITQRFKEIGVRKVMGASAGSIVRLLVLDFVRWVALANLFAWPLIWFGASKWLESFAYRIDIAPLPFLIASLAALAVAIITVISQSWRAALINPARALRYE
ncbi:MAG: ABC transporter permease [Calditrichae bacterium]|nr:ABC transporter permease [Calditrichia bacterium]